jgi:hypothetical protein
MTGEGAPQGDGSFDRAVDRQDLLDFFVQKHGCGHDPRGWAEQQLRSLN